MDGLSATRARVPNPLAPSNPPSSHPQDQARFLPPFMFKCEESRRSKKHDDNDDHDDDDDDDDEVSAPSVFQGFLDMIRRPIDLLLGGEPLVVADPMPGPKDPCGDYESRKKCGRHDGCTWCEGSWAAGQCFSEVRPGSGGRRRRRGLGLIGPGSLAGGGGWLRSEGRTLRTQVPLSPGKTRPLVTRLPSASRPFQRARRRLPPCPILNPQDRAKYLPSSMFKCEALADEELVAPS